MRTSCCIIGGGPAGMMLGYLLARSGVGATVLEKHKDFFRDFRGDTVHPSTLQVMHELGLLERFLRTVPHSRVEELSAVIGGETFRMSDFRHLSTVCKYIALMPQWDLLNFLAEEGSRLPAFTLKMEHNVTGLVEDGGRVTGVRFETPGGNGTLAADLVVGCDGRHAVSRDAAHLPVVETGVPIDVLWMRLPREDGDPENALGYVDYGHALILINRNDYFQCGMLIRKGAFASMQAKGLDAFRASIEQLAPFMKGRTAALDSWDKVKLLTVQINHLAEWWRDGLLCIGDAAHAMSPVGGIGINIALQDAVAAANHLAGPLRDGTTSTHHLRAVQQYREGAVRRTQLLQRMAHRLMEKVLRQQGHVQPPLALRIVTRIPGFQQMMGRIIGVGFQPEHVELSAARAA